MLRTIRGAFIAGALGCVSFGSARMALAGSHLWRINEIFSNADGTIQFIELKECCGSTIERALAGKPINSVDTGNVFTFPVNLTGNTANRYLLIATPAFAAVPGAPTPDFTFSQIPFFTNSGDLIEWAPLLNYDEFTIPNGDLPLDGINAIHITNYVSDTFITGPNSPTNYAGQSGTINVGCNDVDGDGYGNPGNASCPNGSATDCNDANPMINPGAVEDCDDMVDNDCDMATDCDDSDCDLDFAACPAVSVYGLAAMIGAIASCGGFMLKKRFAQS